MLCLRRGSTSKVATPTKGNAMRKSRLIAASALLAIATAGTAQTLGGRLPTGQWQPGVGLTQIPLWPAGLKIEPVDTVGAGDTFCGYLAASLDAGLSFKDALRRAAVAGSLACLKPGAQPSIPFASAVDAMV